MWCRDEDTFKPDMYVGGDMRQFPLQGDTAGDSCQSNSGELIQTAALQQH